MTNRTEEIATKLASETAIKASELATTTSNTAVALASKTAESMAAISTDISWIKQSLSNIELKLGEMQKAFVTATQHTEVLKRLDDIEPRVTKLEFWRSTLIASWGVAAALLTFFYFQLAQPFISEVVRHINGR